MLSIPPCSPLAVLAALIAALAVGAPPARALDCDGPLRLLVDRSASMAEHDPLGALRLAVADALEHQRPARAGDAAWPFDARLGEPAPVESGGWPSAVSTALAGGDRGATSLGSVLAELPRAGGGLLVITDPEAALPVGAGVGDGLLVVVVGGSARADLHAAVRAAGGRIIEVARPAEAMRERWCGREAREVVRDVVLVSGLRSTTAQVRGAQTAAGCAPAGPLGGWCTAFAAQGYRVWIPSAAPRRAGGAVLDTTGGLAANAAALQAWWTRAGRSGRPVLIGHSMGGLIAHAAMRRGLRARGLVTVGTPHAGSFGADAYFAALAVARSCSLSCPATSAQLLAAAVVLRGRFGAALGDLTREQRTRVAPLGAPPAPLATWAGATSRVPGLPSGVALDDRREDRGAYISPNDGIVGAGSATGSLAGLRPVVSVADGEARHSPSVPPAGAATQLSSPVVARWLLDASARLTTATAQASAAGRRAARRASARPRRLHAARPRAGVRLRPLTPIEAGSDATIDTSSIVVATAPIGVWCDDEPAALAQVLPDLWFVDLGALGCGSATASRSASGGAGWALGAPAAPGAQPEELTATRRRHGGWLIRLRLAAPGRITLLRGRQRIGMRPAPAAGEWPDRLTWRAIVGNVGARDLTVRVRGHRGPARIGSLHLP